MRRNQAVVAVVRGIGPTLGGRLLALEAEAAAVIPAFRLPGPFLPGASEAHEGRIDPQAEVIAVEDSE